MLSEPPAGCPQGLAIFYKMRLIITMDRDEDGNYVVECPAIPGCISQGFTEWEAVTNIKDAIIGCLRVRAERGLPLTLATREIEVSLS